MTEETPRKRTKQDNINNLKEVGKATQFQKGVSYGPKRPKLSGHLKELRGEAKNYALETIIKTMMMSESELDKIMRGTEVSNTQRLVASLLEKAIEQGCFMRAQFLFNYILGKPTPMEDQKDIDNNVLLFKTNVKADGSIVQEFIDSEESDAFIKEIKNFNDETSQP